MRTVRYSRTPGSRRFSYGALRSMCSTSRPLPISAATASMSAGSTGPQLLYQAIGAGNLRAWADTEAVGHAALAN